MANVSMTYSIHSDKAITVNFFKNGNEWSLGFAKPEQFETAIKNLSYFLDEWRIFLNNCKENHNG